MPFKEEIGIQEKLVVHIRDTTTGKVTTIVVKKPWSEMNLIEKLLHWTGLKRQPGTIQSKGLEYAARLYGDVGTGYAIDVIGAFATPTWTWKTANITYSATGIIVVDNEADPWTDGTWTAIGCKNSVDTDGNRHNNITVDVDTSGGALEWWAQITFTFS